MQSCDEKRWVMQCRISQHAQQQMSLRGIPSQAVDAVMQSPGQVVNEAKGKRCYQSHWNNNGTLFLLRLIVADDVTPAVVVTVYYTSQIDKYWI